MTRAAAKSASDYFFEVREVAVSVKLVHKERRALLSHMTRPGYRLPRAAIIYHGATSASIHATSQNSEISSPVSERRIRASRHRRSAGTLYGSGVLRGGRQGEFGITALRSL